MKIRNGFVSNSSTSSFIILGWKTSLSEDQERILLRYFGEDVKEDETSYQEILNDYDFVTEGWKNQYSGLLIAYGYDDTVSMSLEELKQQLNKIEEIRQLLQLPEPMMFSGTTEG